jgi:hypothetical protein
MENVPIETWLTVMGMTGLGLVLVIGVVLSVKRLFAGRRKPAKASQALKPTTPQFEDEVQIRVFRQQADKAFQSISAVIDEEYRNLLKMIENGRLPGPLDLKTPSVLDSPAQLQTRGRTLYPAAPRSPYAAVETHVKQGKSVREISKILSIPQDEVELAIKLRSARSAGFRG